VGWLRQSDQLEFRHGSFASAHRDPPLAGVAIAVCTRRVHPRSVPAPVHRRATVCFGRAAVVAPASAGVVDCDAFAQSGRGPVTRTSRLASVLPVARTLARGADAARISAANRGQRPAPDQSTLAGAIGPPPRRAAARGRADGRDGFAGGLQRLQKKTLALTPPPTRPWAGARSRPARAAGLSVTRNTPCVCGCPRRTRR
jgi:hypothetical protein